MVYITRCDSCLCGYYVCVCVCVCFLPIVLREEYLLKPRLLCGWDKVIAELKGGSVTLFRWLCSEGREKAQRSNGEGAKGAKKREGDTRRWAVLVNGKSAHL